MVTTGAPYVLPSTTTRNRDEAWAGRLDVQNANGGNCSGIRVGSFDHFLFRHLKRQGSFTALRQHLAIVHLGHVCKAFAVPKIPLGYEVYELGLELLLPFSQLHQLKLWRWNPFSGVKTHM